MEHSKLYIFFTKKKFFRVKFLLAFHQGRPDTLHRLSVADHCTKLHLTTPNYAINRIFQEGLTTIEITCGYFRLPAVTQIQFFQPLMDTDENVEMGYIEHPTPNIEHRINSRERGTGGVQRVGHELHEFPRIGFEPRHFVSYKFKNHERNGRRSAPSLPFVSGKGVISTFYVKELAHCT